MFACHCYGKGGTVASARAINADRLGSIPGRVISKTSKQALAGCPASSVALNAQRVRALCWQYLATTEAVTATPVAWPAKQASKQTQLITRDVQ